MTRSITTTVFLALMMMACKPQYKELVIEKHANNQPKLVRTYLIEKGDTTFTHEVQYFASGQKSIEGALDHGQRDSTWTTWREDGKLWSQSTYQKGLANGIAVAYHATGMKYYEGRFVNGKRVGIWRFYDENGKELNTKDFGPAQKAN